MNHQHRDRGDRPLGPPPPWRADEPGSDGCGRPACGHPIAAHDRLGDACSMCPCTSYVRPHLATALVVAALLAVAAFVVAMAVISGAHP